MIALRSRLRPPLVAALILLPPLAAGARADPACLASPKRDCAFAWALAAARADRTHAALRIGALMYVAAGLAQAGRSAEAAAVFEEVRAAGTALPSPGSADDTLAMLAGGQARAGLFEGARTTARGIADGRARAKAFSEIAAALVERGRFEDAVATARAIEIFAGRSDALVAVGRALAEAGRIEEALAAARAIPEDIQRLRVLHKVADLFARERRPEADAILREGIALARRLSGESEQAIFVGQFAGVLARLGRDGEAMALADSIARPELRHSALGPIASAQAETGRIDAALATLKLIDARNRDRDNPVFARTAAMRDIVRALAKAGRLDEAAAIAATMRSANDYRHVALRAVALAYAGAGRFEQAIAYARSIGSGERDYGLRALVPVLVEAGRFDDALAIGRSLAQGYERAPAIAAVGAGFWKADRKPAAEAAFREALSAAEALPEGLFRSEALVKIALLLPR